MRLARKPLKPNIRLLFHPDEASAADAPPSEKKLVKPRRSRHADRSEPETYAPERGEVFFEEEPRPFAESLREILDEYRTDSSPDRYAMAVELEETEEGDEPADTVPGDPDEPEEPIYPEEGFSSSAMLDAFLSSGEFSRHGDGAPEAGADEAAPGAEDLSLQAILREYGPGDSVDDAMHFDGSDSPEPEAEGAAPAWGELPAGIEVLSSRRSTSDAPLHHFTHLSVEDILAEYHGGPVPTVEQPAEEPAASPAVESERHGRVAAMAEEARSLFAVPAAADGIRESVPLPGDEENEEVPDEAEAADLPVSSEEEPPVSPEPEVSAPSEAEAPADAGEVPAEADAAPSGAAEEASGTADAGSAEKGGRFAGILRRFAGKKKPAEGAGDAGSAKERKSAPSDYATDLDYEPEPEGSENAFPSFGQYLLGQFSVLLLRIRGVSPKSDTETMETDEEDLGAELRPSAASSYYGSFIRSLRTRFRLSLVLWVIMLYLSLGLPVSGMLRTLEVASGMCLGLQLAMLLLSLDIVAGAVVNLTRGRFGADALAVFSCFITSVDALVVMLRGFGTPHVPFCLLSSLGLLGVLYASLLSARGLRKALRVPAIGKKTYSVTAEKELKGDSITLLKSLRPVSGFVRRTEEAAPDETAFCRAAPLLLLLSLLLSLIVALAKHAANDMLFIFSAILCPAVPVTALLNFALPFHIGSQRIFPSGAAIAGWSGLCDIGSSNNLIVTDRDLFPEGSISIDSVRLTGEIPDDLVLSYAGTMIGASGSCLAPCFADLLVRNGSSLRSVEDFRYLPGGGLSGTINGSAILCGGSDLMRLMDVRFPQRLVDKTTVMLAVDGRLHGIFHIKYEAAPSVRQALIDLMRSNRHAVFAIRDFNINPEMLRETFDVATDGYDFPPYVERAALSEAQPAENRKIAAVLCREGLAPLVNMADTGRSMFLAIRINLVLSLAAAVFGVLLVFMQLISAGTVSLPALLFFMLVWIVPVALVSLFLKL